MARIDSHHHLWAINDTDYVWMTDEHAVIRRDFLPADVESLFAASGIDGSVVVQARQMIEETAERVRKELSQYLGAQGGPFVHPPLSRALLIIDCREPEEPTKLAITVTKPDRHR